MLREVEANDLATALKGVRPDVRDKVVRNLSERAAENLAEELGVRLVKKEAASIAVAFLTTEALKVCDRPIFTSLLPNA